MGDKYSEKTFYVINVDHMGLIRDSQVKLFVNELIANNSSTGSYSNIEPDILDD